MLLVNEVLPYLIRRIEQLMAEHLKCDVKEVEERLAQKLLKHEEGDHARVPVKYVHDAVSSPITQLASVFSSLNLATHAASSATSSSVSGGALPGAPQLNGAQPSLEAAVPTVPVVPLAKNPPVTAVDTSLHNGVSQKKKKKGGGESQAAQSGEKTSLQATSSVEVKVGDKIEESAPSAISISNKMEDKAEDINEQWLEVPNELKNFSVLSSLLGVGIELDKLPLAFNRTWGELVLADFGGFKSLLINNLKEKNFTDNKMFILNRFKRQLILFSQFAKKALAEREKALVKQPERYKQKLTESIERVVVGLISTSVIEARDLISEARSHAAIPLVYNLKLERGPGETEILLHACEETCKQFVELCASFSKTIEKGIYHPTSMLDLLPGVLSRPLGHIFQRAASYLAENLFDTAKYHAYEKLNLSRPCSWMGFDENLSKSKREHIFRILECMIDAVSSLKEGTLDYWEKLLSWTHQGYKQASQDISTGSRLMSYVPMYGSVQRCPKVWQDCHSELLSIMPSGSQREEMLRKHRECKW